MEFLYSDLDTKYRYYLFNQVNRGNVYENSSKKKKGKFVSLNDNINKDTTEEEDDSFVFQQQQLLQELTPYKKIKASVVTIDSRYRLYYRPSRRSNESGKQIGNISGKDPVYSDIENEDSGYKNPNHYKVFLGNTFKNIFSVRLLSMEIPNLNHLEHDAPPPDGGGCCDDESGNPHDENERGGAGDPLAQGGHGENSVVHLHHDRQVFA